MQMTTGELPLSAGELFSALQTASATLPHPVRALLRSECNLAQVVTHFKGNGVIATLFAYASYRLSNNDYGQFDEATIRSMYTVLCEAISTYRSLDATTTCT